MKWTESFIIKYQEYFDWNDLTLNPNIRWSENLLFKVEDRIIWRDIIGNPNVRWSKKTIDKVDKVRKTCTAFNHELNYHLIDIALSRGFKPYNSFNILEKAIEYLEMFKIDYSSDKSKKTIWNALSKNPNIPWTIEDLRDSDKINIEELINSKNKLPLEFIDLIKIKEYFTKRYGVYHSGNHLLEIELENDSFWTPDHIKHLNTYCNFGAEVGEGYFLHFISHNNSIKWDIELFNFVKNNSIYHGDEFFPLTGRENFFEFLINSYGKTDLITFFNRIYDADKCYP